MSASLEDLKQAVRTMRGYQRAYFTSPPRSPERASLLESAKGAERKVDALLAALPASDDAPSLRRVLAALATDPLIGARIHDLACSLADDAADPEVRARALELMALARPSE